MEREIDSVRVAQAIIPGHVIIWIWLCRWFVHRDKLVVEHRRDIRLDDVPIVEVRILAVLTQHRHATNPTGLQQLAEITDIFQIFPQSLNLVGRQRRHSSVELVRIQERRWVIGIISERIRRHLIVVKAHINTVPCGRWWKAKTRLDSSQGQYPTPGNKNAPQGVIL